MICKVIQPFNYQNLKRNTKLKFTNFAKKLDCFVAKPFAPRNDMKRKFAFTLAEGATHIAKSAKPRRAAFTLAEVLITLGIIGVVAAMTLPTLINNYEKKETVSKLKKVYAVLTNTTQMAMAEYGDTTGWDLQDGYNVSTGKYFAEKYLIPYLKVAKTCEDNSSADCNYSMHPLDGQSYTLINEYDQKSYKFYLVDGTFIMVLSRTDYTPHPKLVYIVFDINGQKNPNKYGRDIFILQYILQNNLAESQDYVGKILPVWIDADSRAQLVNSKCNKNTDGRACLALIFIDGWEIKNDYPW